ncbi:MAG: hypothetical protein ABSH34_20320 [Verrucomicrobiota bacterium]
MNLAARHHVHEHGFHLFNAGPCRGGREFHLACGLRMQLPDLPAAQSPIIDPRVGYAAIKELPLPRE